METSKDLSLTAQKEENDIKSFALQCKALREARSERFIEDWLPLLKTRYSILEGNGKYTIATQIHGIVDYFPKANKVLVRKDNDWHKPGLQWIINNLLK